jgi:hypothetical protein
MRALRVIVKEEMFVSHSFIIRQFWFNRIN